MELKKYNGSFSINKPVDDVTYKLLKGLSETRRMKRDVVKLGKRVYNKKRATKENIAQWEKEFGVEGEFWVGDTEDCGKVKTEDVINYDHPPKSQPNLSCCWTIDYDKKTILWKDNADEDLYDLEWIMYIVNNILKPRGYVLNGVVSWKGEDLKEDENLEDRGKIKVTNNVITVRHTDALNRPNKSTTASSVDQLMNYLLNGKLR